MSDRTSNPVASLQEWLQEQWTRIQPVPHSQPGSYDRGYQNGMADILRGVQSVLDRPAAETNTVLGVGVHQANAMLAESVRVSERRANRYWMALRKIMQIKGPPYLEAVEIATVALRSPEETGESHGR